MSAVLTSIYNNYLTTYAPKSTTQYDTHKKSELRSVYNSIVKLNKDAPWCLPVNNLGAQEFAVNLKENARTLCNSVASLDGLNKSLLLGRKTAYSDNESVVSASFIGEQQSPEDAPSLEIEVKQLASGQVNRGSFLPDTKVKLPVDTYSFDIGINDLNYEFQFSIKDGESNRDVQERLIRLINNADVGLSASLDEFDHLSSIRFASNATGATEGKELLFTVTDDRTSRNSGTVEYFGLDAVSAKPENAVFYLNGQERTVSSNNFTIAKTYELQLKGISPEGETASICTRDDTVSLTSNIRTLIGSYNSFVRTATEYSDNFPKSGRLASELGHMVTRYQPEFESMGLTLQRDNTMIMDDSLVSDATSEEHATQTLDILQKFASTLVHKAAQVSINPMDYVDKTVVAYKNPGRSFPNPYITSAYSGMLFNSYC